MCGRFTLRTPATVLIEHFALDVRGGRQLPLFEPRYNIAPTQDVTIIRTDGPNGLPMPSAVRWGLIPSWSKERPTGPPMINARGETLAEKATFRAAYRSRRCLIPADGFYEWEQSSGVGRGKKQPYYIHRADNRPFAFAGLWERWAPAPELALESCTIVTTAANSALCDLHDRMPVVLSPADYSLWLDPATTEPAKLAHLLSPCPNDELTAEPVSTHVNRVANDDPKCIQIQRVLF